VPPLFQVDGADVDHHWEACRPASKPGDQPFAWAALV